MQKLYKADKICLSDDSTKASLLASGWSLDKPKAKKKLESKSKQKSIDKI